MKLKDYLPPFIAQTKEFTAIFNSEQIEFDDLNELIEDIVNQCFIDTATWGLKYWEEIYGITIDETKDIEFRRSVVKSKKRGSGTVTVSLIKNVAESFSNGEVDVIENVEPYTFEIKFTGTKGIPPNLDDLKKSINEIKPAHLVVKYSFTWLTWDEFDNYNKIWDEWDALNLTWDEFETYREVM